MIETKAGQETLERLKKWDTDNLRDSFPGAFRNALAEAWPAIRTLAQEGLDSREHIRELEKQLKSAHATIRLLESNPTAQAIAASLEDIKAGRVTSLTCVQGGCRESELEQANQALTEAWANWNSFKRVSAELSALEQDRTRLDGAGLIRTERERQISAEGWTPTHDDDHVDGELQSAAHAYLSNNPVYWPWEGSWWRPSKDRIRNLVKAGALIAAEIDRLQRAVAMLSTPAQAKSTEGNR